MSRVNEPLEKLTTTPETAKMSSVPDWMVGAGLDTDMTGDPNTGGSSGNRFWMPPGSEKTIVLLTEGNAMPVIWEHQPKIGGSFRNWFTCLDNGKKEGEKCTCDLCAYAAANKGKGRRYKAAFGTLIDTSEWTDDKGKKHSNTRRLLCSKKETTEILKRRYLQLLEDGKGLQYAIFKVFRSTADKSPSCGDDWQYVRHADPAKLPSGMEEFNYAEMLAPNEKAVADAVRQLTGEASYNEPANKSKTDIPF